MTDSQTPRTDAIENRRDGYNYADLFSLARSLERENVRLREALTWIADPNASFADKALAARTALAVQS